MSENVASQESPERIENLISFKEFLESTSPGKFVMVRNVVYQVKGNHYITPQEIKLHCKEEGCGNLSIFQPVAKNIIVGAGLRFNIRYGIYHYSHILIYRCTTCSVSEKIYSIAITGPGSSEGECYKFGELPGFSPPTSQRLISLIRPDWELFIKGRRCENHGLGIGAFAYYRQVVEHQKDRILDEIIKVAEKSNISEDQINTLKSAKEEKQFTKAISNVKDVIPEKLFIEGQNPLTLLHSALSEGLHAKTDEECLEYAQAIRVVMDELSNRLIEVLKDDVELKAAVSNLLKR